MANIPRGTSLYAAYRADLAYQRVVDWQAEAQRLEDHADTLRSKSARTRARNQAAKAARNADRAATEFLKWQAEAEKLIAKEEKRRKRRKRVPPPAKRYEYILKVSYETGRKRSDRAHHVWWDVRFRKLDGSRATEQEIAYAVRRIHMGEIPNGWEVTSIAWDRGRRPDNLTEPERVATSQRDLLSAMGQLGATMDNRGGVRAQRGGGFVGNNFTVGEEEV